jgi:hypothetical protein
MKEIAEFRIVERNADLLFDEKFGRKLGGIARKVQVDTSSPLFNRVGELQNKLNARGDSFFLGWQIHRKYTNTELEAARLLHLTVTAAFEPTGEECGTVYDDHTACRYCGAGAKRVGPLILNLRRIPKGKDFCKTIGGELIVSSRAAELIVDKGLRGAILQPVVDFKYKSESVGNWFEFSADNDLVTMVPPTRFGNDPFDDDERGEYRCPLGHLAGLALLSEVSVSAMDLGDNDFFETRQFVGVRRGLLRPEKVILISQKAFQAFSAAQLTGYNIEVANVAP